MQPSGRSSGSVRIQPHSPPRFATFGFRKDFSCRGKQAVYCIADVAAAGPNDIRSMRHLVTQTISQVGRARGRTELTELNIEHPEAVDIQHPWAGLPALRDRLNRTGLKPVKAAVGPFFIDCSRERNIAQAALSHAAKPNFLIRVCQTILGESLSKRGVSSLKVGNAPTG